MSGSKSPEVFDVDRIRQLVEMMRENELSEMDLQSGETRIQLRREKETIVATTAPAPVMMHAPAPAPMAAPAAAPLAAAAQAPVDDPNTVVIESPMVGTFYSAPDPESPAYINVGDNVGPESVVCLIEAMKVFNEIQAETAGKVIAVLVKNGDPVEFGQPLFKVNTAG